MNLSELSRCECMRQKMRLPRRLRGRVALLNAGIEPVPEQLVQARRLRPEWQEFLDQSDYAFAHDALSHDLVSLEEAGLEEPDTRAVFGFEGDGVSSGVWGVLDHFYEEPACEFTTD